MTRPPASAATGASPTRAGDGPVGMLLVRGDADPVADWATSGLTPVRVVPLDGGWCAVVPTTTESAVPAPYDTAVDVLLARPVPHRLRPAVGALVVRGQALLAVTPGGWRPVQRWLAWRPGTGLVRPGGLPTLRLSDLVRAVGVSDPGAVGRLADVVHDPAGEPLEVLRDLLVALRLPGADLLDSLGVPPGEGSSHPGTLSVEPSPRGVAAFGRMVTDDASWHDELEGRAP